MKHYQITVRRDGAQTITALATCATMFDAQCVGLALLGDGNTGRVKVSQQ